MNFENAVTHNHNIFSYHYFFLPSMRKWGHRCVFTPYPLPQKKNVFQ